MVVPIARDMEEQYFLRFRIKYAKDIDNETIVNNPRLYRAFWRMESVGDFQTPEAKGSPDPVWEKNFYIRLDNCQDSDYLYLEIYRLKSTSDPGTSTGNILVGRARIPLQIPSVMNLEWIAEYELVQNGTQCKRGGSIIVSMMVKKMKVRV